MITMHGLFDLQADIDAMDFADAFAKFAAHLQERNLINDSRCMRHQPHDGYNSNHPETNYYVSMDFDSMAKAQECWDVIEEQSEPLNGLHVAVLGKIQDYRFFLTTDL